MKHASTHAFGNESSEGPRECTRHASPAQLVTPRALQRGRRVAAPQPALPRLPAAPWSGGDPGTQHRLAQRRPGRRAALATRPLPPWPSVCRALRNSAAVRHCAAAAVIACARMTTRHNASVHASNAGKHVWPDVGQTQKLVLYIDACFYQQHRERCCLDEAPAKGVAPSLSSTISRSSSTAAASRSLSRR